MSQTAQRRRVSHGLRANPEGERAEEGGDVNDHRLVEGLELVEAALAGGLPEFGGELAIEQCAVVAQGGVEGGGVSAAVGAAHFGEALQGIRRGASTRDVHEGGARALPVVAGAAGLGGGDDERGFERGHGVELLHVRHEFVEGGLVEFLAGLLCAGGGDAFIDAARDRR